MAHTTNYSLPLPQLGEPADIRVLDQGTEMIDGIMHGNRTMIAPGWVSTETYNTGSRVVYLGEYYKCKADNTTGAWDATKWDKTTVGEDIEGLGTGGASALADLDDVEITNPSTGQVLSFDDDDKWKNKNLPDVSVTKEASGNPIEFTDGAAAPIVKCVTEIQGSQDLHGYDKPWVGGAGKNKLNANDSYTVAANTTWLNNIPCVLQPGDYTFSYMASDTTTGAITFKLYDSSDNVIAESAGIGNAIRVFTFTINTTSAYLRSYSNSDQVFSQLQIENGSQPTAYSPYSNLCPITAYTEGEIEVRGKNLFDKDYGSIPNKYITNNGDIADSAPDRPCTLYTQKIKVSHDYNYRLSALGNSGFYLRVAEYDKNDVFIQRIITDGIQTVLPFQPSSNVDYILINPDTSCYNIQLEQGTTATTYEPYTSTTHTTTFSQSIYQGNADFVGGSVECYVRMLTFDGSESWLSIGDTDKQYFYLSLGETQLFVNDDAICSHYIDDTSISISNRNIGIRVFYSTSNVSQRIIVRPIGFDSMSVVDFCQYLGDLKTDGNPLQITARLIVPTNDPITPTNLPIKSLSGYTHIESSTGSMTVEYISGNYQALVDLIQSSSHVYSTAEQVVGKWIDGRDVYEQTIIFQNVISLTANTFTDVYDLSTIGVESLVEFTPYTDNIAPLRPFGYFIPDITSAGMLRLNIPSTRWYIGGMTIRYTKTTQTRSLSAPVTSQKAQIEPLSEKEEEIPVEEEKAVETPVVDETVDETVDENGGRIR